MDDDPTLAVYRREARRWVARRRPPPERLEPALALGRAALPDAPVLDAGCGPGWFAPALASSGAEVVALDAALAMLHLASDEAPGAHRACADLRNLPFRRHAFGAAWGSKSYVHLPRADVPGALAELHRTLRVGAPLHLRFFGGDLEHGELDGDDFAGRRFSLWPAELLAAVIEGAGFEVESLDERSTGDGGTDLLVAARRARTLADSVGPGMRLLVVGLNPSLYAADAGVGFARPGNRFWPAALAAGIVTSDRDPRHALAAHGVGMTDLVKRATARADELRTDEYRAGLERLDRLAAWLAPDRVCIVGLSGWRAAADRRAAAGWHPRGVGSRPVYVMPNPSGLNASSTLDDLAQHLARAAHGDLPETRPLR